MENAETGVREPRALIAGASGLVGGHILRLLSLEDFISEVRALVRRSLPSHEKGPRVREYIVDFEHLERSQAAFNVDIIFSAVGTTIYKAGSRKAFRRVDLDYQLAVAKSGRAAGARHFLLVSALGANSRSPFFYNRVKGELEEAVLALGYPSVTIARPSFLLGERPEPRLGEELVKRFQWLVPSPWSGVHASQVAAALVQAAREDKSGVKVLENKYLRASRPLTV